MLHSLHRRLGLKTTPGIFFPAAAFILLFSAATIAFPQTMIDVFGTVSEWIMTYLGWLYVLGTALFAFFLIYVCVSRFGRIKLGPDDSEPQHSTLAWFGMTFAAGVGAVLMFWGAAEPLTHFARPPYDGVEPGSQEAALDALSIADFHIGLGVWVLLTVPALGFGYFTYKRRLPPRVSSSFQPLLGDGIHGPWGKTIDVISLIASVFGIAVSVGLGALQLNSGVTIMYGVPVSGWVQAVIIALITAVALTSVLNGMDKGVKRLSTFNIVLAMAFLLFILMAGSTMFALRGVVESVGNFLYILPKMMFFNDTFANTGWLGQWPVFYWAWTICWAPFVGLFLAKISQGRTIRQFVLGVVVLPTAFTMVWVGIFGMNAFDIEMHGEGGLVHTVVDEGDIPGAMFQFLGNFPFLPVVAVVAIVLIFIFFVTSIDSASIVMDSMANGHEDESPIRQRVFWTVSIGLVAASILLFAGELGLDALQNVVIIIGLPVFILTFVQAWMIVRAFKEDAGELPPLRTRQWKQVLPVEEYRRRAQEDFTSVQEYSIHPEYDETTAPEYESLVPNTYQEIRRQRAEGGSDEAADLAEGTGAGEVPADDVVTGAEQTVEPRERG